MKFLNYNTIFNTLKILSCNNNFDTNLYILSQTTLFYN